MFSSEQERKTKPMRFYLWPMRGPLIVLAALMLQSFAFATEGTAPVRGNAIFIHPDGVGVSGWHAARLLSQGPDGALNWDRLPVLGIYRSHTATSLTTSSHAGATMHAYGVKVPLDSFGMWGKTAGQPAEPLTSRSGKPLSLMQEAQQQGFAAALINSGSIVEPGTAVFVASVPRRKQYEAITEQVIHSGVDVILSGGEEWMLPEGVQGHHGPGKRKDGKNLIHWAKEQGYLIVYTREELLAIPQDTKRLLGVFAHEHTFNDQSEEALEEKQLPLFNPGVPTLAEMTRVGLRVMEHQKRPFIMVVEEEGTDNFANENNAIGTFTSLLRADEAIGVAHEFVRRHPETLLVVASDSEAGGPELVGREENGQETMTKLDPREENGAPIDGVKGTNSPAFRSAPDAKGRTFPFRVSWSSFDDTYGSVVVRAAGAHSSMLSGTADNTELYLAMYKALFGQDLKTHP
jgi:alkaline phosphatase